MELMMVVSSLIQCPFDDGHGLPRVVGSVMMGSHNKIMIFCSVGGVADTKVEEEIIQLYQWKTVVRELV